MPFSQRTLLAYLSHHILNSTKIVKWSLSCLLYVILICKGPTTITLRGYSYVSYRIYDWKDRAHSESNRISLLFRVAHIFICLIFIEQNIANKQPSPF